MSLIWGRKIMDHGGIWRVGDGASIKIYKEAWLLHLGCLKVLSPKILNENAHVTELFTSSGGWNVPTPSAVFSEEEVQIILQTSIGGMGRIDSFAWKFTQM